MTDNEIIKAAENCVKYGDCEHCPYDDERGCRGLYADMLDLINRQKAEIERLQNRLATECQHSIEFRNNILSEFAERLKEKVEKVRQKWQRLCKEQGEKEDEVMDIHFNGIATLIDNLVKEMSTTVTKLDHSSLCETETYEG